jgi:Protein of unknown function (DUF2887)
MTSNLWRLSKRPFGLTGYLFRVPMRWIKPSFLLKYSFNPMNICMTECLQRLDCIWFSIAIPSIGGRWQFFRAVVWNIQSELFGIQLMQLIVSKPKESQSYVQQIVDQFQNMSDPQNQAIIELVCTVMVYKFPELSREAIEAMFSVSELK